MNCTGKNCIMQYDKVDPATCPCVPYCPQATPPKTNKKQFIFWQYCKDLNDINKAIETEDGNWEQLKSADQIISVTYDENHGLYVVFWRIPDEEDEYGST